MACGRRNRWLSKAAEPLPKHEHLAGLLAHTALEVDEQLRVLDVWNSRQDFDRFVEQRLQSGMAQAIGDQAQEPEITEVEVHRFHICR